MMLQKFCPVEQPLSSSVYLTVFSKHHSKGFFPFDKAVEKKNENLLGREVRLEKILSFEPCRTLKQGKSQSIRAEGKDLMLRLRPKPEREIRLECFRACQARS